MSDDCYKVVIAVVVVRRRSMITVWSGVGGGRIASCDGRRWLIPGRLGNVEVSQGYGK